MDDPPKTKIVALHRGGTEARHRQNRTVFQVRLIFSHSCCVSFVLLSSVWLRKLMKSSQTDAPKSRNSVQWRLNPNIQKEQEWNEILLNQLNNEAYMKRKSRRQTIAVRGQSTTRQKYREKLNEGFAQQRKYRGRLKA